MGASSHECLTELKGSRLEEIMCILITSLKRENSPIPPSPIPPSPDINAWRNIPWSEIDKKGRIGRGSYGDVYEG